MAKKKKQQKSKDANPGSTGSPSTSPASSPSDSVPASGAASTAPTASSALATAPAVAAAPAKGHVDFDAAARDQFATSFKPAWQVAQEKAAEEKAKSPKTNSSHEGLRSEQGLSGEISLDSIPLPPLPTDKPKRQVIAVLVVILLIIIAGIVVSQSSRSAQTPAAADTSER